MGPLVSAYMDILFTIDLEYVLLIFCSEVFAFIRPRMNSDDFCSFTCYSIRCYFCRGRDPESKKKLFANLNAKANREMRCIILINSQENVISLKP
jgi:hypothetical protein